MATWLTIQILKYETSQLTLTLVGLVLSVTGLWYLWDCYCQLPVCETCETGIVIYLSVVLLEMVLSVLLVCDTCGTGFLSNLYVILLRMILSVLPVCDACGLITDGKQQATPKGGWQDLKRKEVKSLRKQQTSVFHVLRVELLPESSPYKLNISKHMEHNKKKH